MLFHSLGAPYHFHGNILYKSGARRIQYAIHRIHEEKHYTAIGIRSKSIYLSTCLHVVVYAYLKFVQLLLTDSLFPGL